MKKTYLKFAIPLIVVLVLVPSTAIAEYRRIVFQADVSDLYTSWSYVMILWNSGGFEWITPEDASVHVTVISELSYSDDHYDLVDPKIGSLISLNWTDDNTLYNLTLHLKSYDSSVIQFEGSEWDVWTLDLEPCRLKYDVDRYGEFVQWWNPPTLYCRGDQSRAWLYFSFKTTDAFVAVGLEWFNPSINVVLN